MKTMHNTIMALSAAVLLGGCAHSINITPDSAKLASTQAQTKIDKVVGYYISEPNKALEVTTPAGGGDSVKYKPYADLEAGLQQALVNVFANAYPIKDIKDQAFLQGKDIAWVFTPTLTTNSSSRNNFFWPPTDFSVTIECTAVDAAQKPVWQTTVKADNDVVAVNAVIKDHGLAGKSAAEKALRQLQNQLQAAPEFRK
ncbi:MAG TPA: hypothetical protein PLX21_13565 [Rhodocyclaceae bacterium]|nr:hypothetical protein [Burkholderiaceae bacterium]HNI82954.1 hypothetical protein [Rhodocyclaceae bacterium]